jgi:hypothetical protein
MMAILNYSTAVPTERTVGEITALLIRKGARSITTQFSETGEMVGISFVMAVGGLPINFLLPSNVDGVAGVMLKDEPWNWKRKLDELAYIGKIRERAKWVAWRILKDWVQAQMALIDSNQAEAAQVFMPFAQQNDGRTMYQMFVEGNQKRLAAQSEIN